MTKANTLFISSNAQELALNQDGSVPDEVHLVPLGHIKGRDGRQLEMQDAAAVVRASIERFNQDSERDDIDLFIDYEHQTTATAHNGKPAPAAGWIKRLTARADGIWGKVDWTERAKEFIRKKEYRYLSPVLLAFKSGKVFAIKGAGLTNDPNLMLTSFNKSYEEETTMDLTKLIAALGLAEGATIEEIIAAVENLKAAATAASAHKQTVDMSQFVELEKFTSLNKQLTDAQNKLTELNATIQREKIEVAVNKAVADGQLPPALKDNASAIYEKMGEEAFKDFVGKMPKVSPNKSEAPAGAPAKADGELSAEEIAICKQMEISEEKFKQTKKENE